MDVRGELRSKLLVAVVRGSYADDGESIGQELFLKQIVERGNELALGKIPGRAKNHDHARVAHARFAVDHGVLRCGTHLCQSFPEDLKGAIVNDLASYLRFDPISSWVSRYARQIRSASPRALCLQNPLALVS